MPKRKPRPAAANTEKSLQRQREKILAEVRKYAALQKRARPFRPGRDRVHYGGRVFDDKELTAMTNAVLDSWVTLGPHGRQLEKELAAFLGMKHVILVNSGSSANLLAVGALCAAEVSNGLKPGDEVLTPAATFPTTLAPLLQYQLVPVFIDSRLADYNIDVDRLEGALTQKTRAIMIPHTLGNPCEMDRIMRLAERYQLFVIEDNCDALGSRFQQQLTGTFGTLSTFSFYPAHHMTMGEGGAVATQDDQLAKIVRSLRDWGRDCWCVGDTGAEGACGHRLEYKIDGVPEGYDHRYVYTRIGYNLKPTDIQAALGLAQIKKVPRFNQVRRKNYEFLNRALSGFEKWLLLPKPARESDPAWFAYPISVREGAGFTRKELVTWLEARGIETRLLFAGNILRQPAYRFAHYRTHGGLTTADAIMRRAFFIGLYPGLKTAHLQYLAAAFAEFFKTKA